MQRIKDAYVRLSRRIEDLHHMGNTLVRFSNILQAIPDFTALGNEVVVRIDDEKCGDLFIIFQIFHVLSCYAFTKSPLLPTR